MFYYDRRFTNHKKRAERNHLQIFFIVNSTILLKIHVF